MNITDEKFVEVIKSLTQEDFDVMQNLADQLVEKFLNPENKSLFTENEMNILSNLIETNSDEVLISVLITKFQEDLCSQQILSQEH